MPLLDGPDCPLWIERIGEGAPVTLFAHGLTGSVQEMRPLAAATPGTRVLLDMRGHGSSGVPPDSAGYDHAAIRRDLAHVSDAVGATQIYASSASAGALMNLLADAPTRFARMVFARPASIDGPNAGAASLFPGLIALLESRTPEEIWELTLTEQRALFAARPSLVEPLREHTLMLNGVGIPRALRAYLQGASPLRDASVLSRVTAPALIFAHEGDALHDIAVARRLALLLPDARLEVLADAYAVFTESERVADTIGAFFAGRG